MALRNAIPYYERPSLGNDAESKAPEASSILLGQLHDGESYKVILEGCRRLLRFRPDVLASQTGSLFLTSFRLRFVPKPCRCKTAAQLGPPNWHSGDCETKGPVSPWGGFIHTWPPTESILSQLLASEPSSKGNSSGPDETMQRNAYDIPLYAFKKLSLIGRELRITCRDGRSIELELSSDHEGEELMRVLGSMAFPRDEVSGAFAFQTRYRVGLGWDVFDNELDAERTLVSRSHVALKKIERPCETYPAHVYVPLDVSDADIAGSASFRSMGRIPVAVWAHPKNGSILVRSAQPLVGLLGNRNAGDERLIRSLCGPSYLLLDARSRAAALGNRAMGKGTESVERGYEGASELIFCDLGNIHHLKATANNLFRFLLEPPTKVTSNWPIDTPSSTYHHSPEIGAWLLNVSQLLRASMRIVEAMDSQGCSTWTHCSDGWDRTAQMCALAQLIMDPEYRTRIGFAMLVEKNFASYGFKFRERARGTVIQASPGSTSPPSRSPSPPVELTFENHEEETSPVLVLFLDCIFQLLCQFPDRFEFNSSFLVAIADAYVSGRFGNFLCNTEKERIEKKVKLETRSVWDWLCSGDEFKNTSFSPYHGVLFANSSLRVMRLFEPYWARFDPYRTDNPMRLCLY